MLELNLYKNFNMTLADVHKSELANIIIPGAVLDLKAPKESPLKKFLTTFIVATIAFGFIAVGVIVIFKPFEKAPPPVIEAPVAEEKAPPKQEFVQIQVFELTGGSAGSAVPARNITPGVEALPSLAKPSAKQAPADSARYPVAETPAAKLSEEAAAKPVQSAPVKPQAQKTETAKQAPAPIAPSPKSAPVVVKSPGYSLNISGASIDEYKMFKDMSKSKNAELTVIRSVKSTKPVWVLYVPDKDGKVVIENERVAPLNVFQNKEAAVDYAKSNSLETAIIKASEEAELNYDIKICCMSLDDAKLSAQESGITDKVFRIVRE